MLGIYICMRKLIRKILKEEFLTEKVIIEQITFNELKKYLTLTEGLATVKIDRNKENDVLNYIESYYNKINQVNGSEYYFDSESNMGFTIEPTDHWLQRLDRKSEPEYKNTPTILNPNTTEGVDLILDNIQKVTHFIRNFDWGNRVICLRLITYKGGVEYTNVINILKDLTTKRLYKIIMVTHLKGDKLISKKYQKCTPIKS